MLVLPSLVWFSYAKSPAMVLLFLVLALVIVFSCMFGEGAGGDCAGGGGFRARGRRAVDGSPGKRRQ